MKKILLLSLLLLSLLLNACRNEPPPTESEVPGFREITTPADAGGEPNLYVTADGQAFLSWVGYENDTTDAFYFAEDGGKSFTAPIPVDDGAPIGRVDVVLKDEKTAIVSWLEEVDNGGEIRLAEINQKGKLGESRTATTTGVSRQSGFPILEKLDEQLPLAWTSVEGAESTVRSMLITP